MSRKTSGSSFRGNTVEAGMAGRGEKTGTFGRFLLGVVGGSVVVIVGKRREPKRKLRKGLRVKVKRGIKGLMGRRVK